MQKGEADLSGAILGQGRTGKAAGGVDGAHQTRGRRDQPVQGSAEDRQRRHDTQRPPNETSPGDGIHHR